MYGAWRGKRVTQTRAAEVLGVSDRTFRRWAARYEARGLEGLRDMRSTGGSHRKAPDAEVAALETLYAREYAGWNVRRFWERYREAHGGARSYTWVKNRLQAAGLVKRGRRRGRHRKWRPRKPVEGLMLHQDASTHGWFGDRKRDLVITMDDATSRIYSGFFVEQEGTWSSFLGVRETIAAKGIFASLYTDRGSHYWYTPKAGGKVDKEQPTQFGRAMKELGIEMIPSYSPQARGRCDRCFGTRPRLFQAQNLVQIHLQKRDEGSARFLRPDPEHRVEARPVPPQILVRGSHLPDPFPRQLLRQAAPEEVVVQDLNGGHRHSAGVEPGPDEAAEAVEHGLDVDLSEAPERAREEGGDGHKFLGGMDFAVPLADLLLQPKQPMVAGLEVVADPDPPHPAPN